MHIPPLNATYPDVLDPGRNRFGTDEIAVSLLKLQMLGAEPPRLSTTNALNCRAVLSDACAGNDAFLKLVRHGRLRFYRFSNGAAVRDNMIRELSLDDQPSFAEFPYLRPRFSGWPDDMKIREVRNIVRASLQENAPKPTGSDEMDRFVANATRLYEAIDVFQSAHPQEIRLERREDGAHRGDLFRQDLEKALNEARAKYGDDEPRDVHLVRAAYTHLDHEARRLKDAGLQPRERSIMNHFIDGATHLDSATRDGAWQWVSNIYAGRLAWALGVDVLVTNQYVDDVPLPSGTTRANARPFEVHELAPADASQIEKHARHIEWSDIEEALRGSLTPIGSIDGSVKPPAELIDYVAQLLAERRIGRSHTIINYAALAAPVVVGAVTVPAVLGAFGAAHTAVLEMLQTAGLLSSLVGLGSAVDRLEDSIYRKQRRVMNGLVGRFSLETNHMSGDAPRA